MEVQHEANRNSEAQNAEKTNPVYFEFERGNIDSSRKNKWCNVSITILLINLIDSTFRSVGQVHICATGCLCHHLGSANCSVLLDPSILG